MGMQETHQLSRLLITRTDPLKISQTVEFHSRSVFSSWQDFGMDLQEPLCKVPLKLSALLEQQRMQHWEGKPIGYTEKRSTEIEGVPKYKHVCILFCSNGIFPLKNS